MKKGVIYARYSCDKQTDNSTKAQIRECRLWAEHNDIKVIDIYKDEAISGRTDRRPAFQKMIADAQRGYFDCIIVWKGDRFSRSRADAAKYKTLLKKLDVRVLSVTEPNIEGPQAILMDGINEAFAEYYSVELAAKIKRGQDQNLIDGKWNGGSVPFGYNHDPKTQKLSINEEEAQVVRKIFDMYANKGMSTLTISKILAQEGVLTKKGKPLSTAGVHHVLCHEQYIGKYSWKGTTLDNIFPPIITEDLYRKAETARKSKSHKVGYKETGVVFLLSGKLFCGKCGEEMRGTSGTSHHQSKKYYYYVCPNQIKNHVCTLPGVPKEALEDAVIKLIKEKVLFDPANREHYINEILAYLNSQDPELPVLEKELDGIKVKIQKLIALAEVVDDLDEVAPRLKKLKRDKEDKEAELVRARMRSNTMDRSQLEAFFDALAENKFTEVEDRKFLFDSFVKAVYVTDDYFLDIFLNYRGQFGAFAKKTKVLVASPVVHHQYPYPKP